MFYVFHGNDAFSRSEELASLTVKMGDPSLAGLNTTHLDGRTTTLQEIHHHCSTVPFFSDRRLVIVKGLLKRLTQKKPGSAEAEYMVELLFYLPDLPPTTRLIFVEDSELPERHPVLALARDSDVGYAKVFTAPIGRALVRWVQDRVKQAGGEIDPSAAETLCTFVGNDLYQLYQEIQKLVAYTDGQRPITKQDVHLLTSQAREASIFTMVDALGQRDGKTAIRTTHDLLQAGAHPLSVLGMITRQFRLMIQVKELAPTLGTPQRIARELHQNPYPIQKILAQSKNYTMEQLHRVYHQLLDTDVSIKTGRCDPILALDTLIAGLSRIP